MSLAPLVVEIEIDASAAIRAFADAVRIAEEWSRTNRRLFRARQKEIRRRAVHQRRIDQAMRARARRAARRQRRQAKRGTT